MTSDGVGTVLGQMSLVRIFNGLSNERKKIDFLINTHLRCSFVSPRRRNPIFAMCVRRHHRINSGFELYGTVMLCSRLS